MYISPQKEVLQVAKGITEELARSILCSRDLWTLPCSTTGDSKTVIFTHQSGYLHSSEAHLLQSRTNVVFLFLVHVPNTHIQIPGSVSTLPGSRGTLSLTICHQNNSILALKLEVHTALFFPETTSVLVLPSFRIYYLYFEYVLLKRISHGFLDFLWQSCMLSGYF